MAENFNEDDAVRDESWVLCHACGRDQSRHERWPTCACCGHHNITDDELASRIAEVQAGNSIPHDDAMRELRGIVAELDAAKVPTDDHCDPPCAYTLAGRVKLLHGQVLALREQRDKAREMFEAAERQRAVNVSLLRQVAESGLEFEHPARANVTVQIDYRLWATIGERFGTAEAREVIVNGLRIDPPVPTEPEF